MPGNCGRLYIREGAVEASSYFQDDSLPVLPRKWLLQSRTGLLTHIEQGLTQHGNGLPSKGRRMAWGAPVLPKTKSNTLRYLLRKTSLWRPRSSE